MQMHFTLYEGYVKNTNSIIEKLKTLEINSPEWNELHRRFGWEWNGMRNHELFFGNLENNKNIDINNIFIEKISENFGSFEAWKKDFESLCKIRGMGWVMLVQDNVTGKLLNTWVNEHDAGMLSDVIIIFLIDMFEHAYIKDFATNRAGYIESIFQHVNWEAVSKRIK
jgi:Fe-Mn family superoxide dismutase